MNRVRLLPATLAAGGLLLAVKGVELGRLAWSGWPRAMTVVSAAEAAPAPAHAAAPARPEPVPAAAPPPPPAPPADPPVSEAERRLLQDLRARRLELDARDRTLAQREAVLDAAQARLTERIAQLTNLQTRLETLDAERHAHDEANWSGLVKVYEAMKPRDAAAIFNDMDMPVLVQVVDRMKDAKASAVLAAMQPDRARLLTGQLATQRTRSVTVPPAVAG